MTMRTAVVVAAIGGLLGWPAQADAHRLDEYLQATLLSVDGDRVRVEIGLTPGVNAAAQIVIAIDTDGDGTISAPESDAYARRVLSDMSLSIDGRTAPLTLEERSLPDVEAMMLGTGTMRLRAAADVRATSGNHTLVFGNRHMPDASVYLVNVLAPRDRGVRLSAPRRDTLQRSLALDYHVAGRASTFEAGWLLAGTTMIVLIGLGRNRRQRSTLARSHS